MRKTAFLACIAMICAAIALAACSSSSSAAVKSSVPAGPQGTVVVPDISATGFGQVTRYCVPNATGDGSDGIYVTGDNPIYPASIAVVASDPACR